MARDDAYGRSSERANDTWERGLQFQERMWEEIADARRPVRRGVRRRCSRVQPYLANLGGVFERLEKLPVEEA